MSEISSNGTRNNIYNQSLSDYVLIRNDNSECWPGWKFSQRQWRLTGRPTLLRLLQSLYCLSIHYFLDWYSPFIFLWHIWPNKRKHLAWSWLFKHNNYFTIYIMIRLISGWQNNLKIAIPPKNMSFYTTKTNNLGFKDRVWFLCGANKLGTAQFHGKGDRTWKGGSESGVTAENDVDGKYI